MTKGKNLIVVNFFAGPGCGKSTLAAYAFAKLKMAGVNCELVTEFAKDKVWEENAAALGNQIYMFSKQQYRIARCAGKVDVAVTDSPLLLSYIYNSDQDIDAPLKELVRTVWSRYDNLNYALRRTKAYNPAGRLQTEGEAKALDGRIRGLLDSLGEQYRTIDGDIVSADVVMQDVLARLGRAR